MTLQNDASKAASDAQQAADAFVKKQEASVKSNWKWLAGGFVLGLLVAFAVHAVF